MGVSDTISKGFDWFRSFSESQSVRAVYLIVFIIGAAVLFIGALGGVPYTQINIPADGRTPLMIGGAVAAVVGLGALLLNSGSGAATTVEPQKYEFKITQPSHGDTVEAKYPIKGTYKKIPPKGYVAYVIEQDISTGRYRPRKQVNLNDNGTWKALAVSSGTMANRDIASFIMLVGENGQALTAYYDLINSEDPPIKTLTDDFIFCDSIELKTKGSAPSTPSKANDARKKRL